ncbi:Phospholipid phosphatase 6 [Armadillidium nasatum]|uniref:Phospholipid phosphatase 6 n=1 Tax=Armadillidium nasatum TaxID=96803 RepID=A0A5N5SPH0_9CRUS|nr:Phospholipid phosphatase 6 [Armadillidium nasatum]
MKICFKYTIGYKMSHTTLKRDVHPVLKTLLNWDVEVSKKFVKFVDMNFGPITLLIDVAMTAVVKASARRRRPFDNPNDMFATFAMDKFSFPSGHSSRAVMLFFLLLRQYYLIFPLPIVMLLWCSAICLSRVLMRRHHILDVLGGAFIGWFEAVFISNFIWLSNDTCNSLVNFFFSTK